MDVFFGKVKNPCDDCVYGECTMNCSGRELSDEKDFGSCFVTREKDNTVTIRVRSPNAYGESSINVPWKTWVQLCKIGSGRRK